MGKLKDSVTNWSTNQQDGELKYEKYGNSAVYLDGMFTKEDLQQVLAYLEEADKRSEDALTELMRIKQ